MKKALIASLAISSVMAQASLAGGVTPPITIDNFIEPLSETVQVVSGFIPSAFSNDVNLPLTSVIGGTRLTTLDILAPIAPESIFDAIQITQGSTETGVLDQSVSGAVGNFSTTKITWNGGGNGLNLDLPTFDRFAVILNLLDLYGDNRSTTAIGTFTLRVRDSFTSPYSEFSRTLDRIFAPTTFYFNFSDFSNPSIFRNPLQEIQLEITGQQGLLFTLEDIAIPTPDVTISRVTTPEPSLATGCLVLVATRIAATAWRKRR